MTKVSQQVAATDLCMRTITSHHTVSLSGERGLFIQRTLGTRRSELVSSCGAGFEVTVDIWVGKPAGSQSDTLSGHRGQFILHQCLKREHQQIFSTETVSCTKALRTDTQSYPCSPSQSTDRRTTLEIPAQICHSWITSRSVPSHLY